MQALLGAYGSKATVVETKKRESERPAEDNKRTEEKKAKQESVVAVAPKSTLPGLDSDSDEGADDGFVPKQAKTGHSSKEQAKFSTPKLMIPPQVRTGVPNVITEDREALFSKKTPTPTKK